MSAPTQQPLFMLPTKSFYATLDGAVTAGTISNGDLTYTKTTGSAGMARSTAQKNSGKWYFEVTAGQTAATGVGHNDWITIITPAATDTQVVTSGTKGGIVFAQLGGDIFSNDGASGFTLGADITTGDIIGVAADLDNHKIWFRKAPSGNWNGVAIGSSDPASNLGGASLTNYNATTLAPALGFDAILNNQFWTANFGQNAFTGTVPSGFTSGWTN